MTASNNSNNQPKQTWIDALRGGQPIEAVIGAAQAARQNASAQQVSEGTAAGAAARGGSEKRAAQPVGAGALPNLHLGRGIRYGNLTWFPIFTDAPVAERKYATAATAAKVAVVEQSNPSVGHLQVKNDAATPVLLFEGTLLEGGWQHRALTHTVWVDAQTTTEIPVVCVEAGRWNGVSTQRFGNKSAPARVRRAIRGIKINSDGAAVQAFADQSEVWSEVRNFANVTAKQNQTQSLVEIKNELEAEIAQRKLAKPFVECKSQLARDFVARIEALGVQPTEHKGRLRNRADKYVASEALISSAGEFLHLATINPAHELVLAA